MLKKEELIELIEKGIYWEDDFIMKYDSEDTWGLLEASLPEDKFNTTREIFSQNIEDTKRHSKMLNALITTISQSDKNEY